MRSEYEVRSSLAGIDYIVPGEVGDLPGPTEIRDARSGEVIRERSQPVSAPYRRRN